MRGGGVKRISSDEELFADRSPDPDLVMLDDALNELARFDPRKARIVELKFFGGMDQEETAGVLQVSRETVKRDWRLAKSWFMSALRKRGEDES
jgi:RNA polymerase sigma-70 factor (ECF subfamily)